MFKEIAKKAVQKLAATSKRGLAPEMEVVFQNIFSRDLRKLGLNDNFYPVGAAANYSLMYLIARICSELDVKNVVELGAGQSSMLLSALISKGILSAEITTVEHDVGWVERLKHKISHNIICCDLIKMQDEAGSYMGYDFADKVPKSIDLLLIDGPPAYYPSVSLSRHGALALMDHIDPSGCIIIIDDAERAGEHLLSQRIARTLDRKNITYRRNSIAASKKQVVFATGRLLEAGFF